MKASRINLTIDRVAVHGLDNDQREAFSCGLRKALLRQLGKTGLVSELAPSQRQRVVVRLPAPGSTDELAANVANAVVTSVRGKY